MSKEISNELINQFNQEYHDRKEAKVLERTVTKNGILNASRNLAADIQSTPVFSIDLDTGDVANQKQSGRCWMFAALNTMRHDMKISLRCQETSNFPKITPSSGISLKNQTGSTKTSLKPPILNQTTAKWPSYLTSPKVTVANGICCAP